MPSKLRTSLVALVASAALAVGGPALAQPVSPFFDDTMKLSRAFGLELIASRLHAVEALDGDFGGYGGQVTKLLSRDIRRFEGALTAADAALAAELRDALQAVVDDVQEGRDASASVAAARSAHARAYDLVVPEGERTLAFTAMVLADLLLQDDGVAEAYEDAAEDDLWEYPSGYGALVRVKAVWTERVAGHASAEQVADVDEMFAFLDTVVYPSVRPPAAITGDPEEAEAATQRITGILESIAGADLYPSRNLGRLAESLAETLAPACTAYQAGDDLSGVEGAYAVRNPYRKHLRRLLDLIAPDIHEPTAVLLDALISTDPPADRGVACLELHELLLEARGVL